MDGSIPGHGGLYIGSGQYLYPGCGQVPDLFHARLCPVAVEVIPDKSNRPFFMKDV